MGLLDTLGAAVIARIDALNREKKIIAVHQQDNGTCLVLRDSSKILLEGTSEDDGRKIVGYLGFYGKGENGLDTPAFLIKPDGYPDRV
jgi:hypothetical protein